MQDIDELEQRAIDGDADAARMLAAAARQAVPNAEPRYRVTTLDGRCAVMTTREYLSATATDLARAKVEMVR